jgi:uncharacterized protein
MLKVDLGRLSREESVLVEARIPQADALWKDSGLDWSEPVDVRIRVSLAGSGEIVGRGSVKGTLRHECRRCLDPVSIEFAVDLTLVFVEGDAEADLADAGAFVLDGNAPDLDLGKAVREEVFLAMNPYVVCDPECPGLCPRCGVDLRKGACDCAETDSEPRWDALR